MDKWTNGSTLVYATSIASTWAWAPALFLSAKQAYTNGWFGFLLFYFPNVFTLFLFGLFAYYVRTHQQDGDYVTVEELVKSADYRQAKIHLIMTLIILFCSCCMQLMGIFMVLNSFVSSKYIAAFGVFLISLWTMKDGIKSCIKTDLVKYFIIIFAGVLLLTQIDGYVFSLAKHTTKTYNEIWTSFGVPTVLGLLCAPYIDSTFIQRMYCVPKEKLVKTFSLAAFLFSLIPLLYGMLGFYGIENLSETFNTGVSSLLLLVAVLAALLSTLDSNLCALGAIANQYFPKYRSEAVATFYLAVAYIMIAPPFDMTRLFTLYCTIRCTMLIPTLLIVSGYYDKTRLFYISAINCAVACIGYLMTADFVFTVIGLLTPILAISFKELTYEHNQLIRR